MVPSTMRTWIFFLLCLAGRALAAPQQTEVAEEIVEERKPWWRRQGGTCGCQPSPGGNGVSLEEGAEETVEEVVADNPCQNHHCKHGKVELDAEQHPHVCVCQDPTSCPAPIGEFEKYIAPCLDSELTEFPLRMRDWLKNVLVTLYERDEGNNLLTEKQKLRVKKIHENEKRLEAGDHPVELLARDFEKNYNMYIFPVHWQFGQLDQHPIDGYLSHTELAPLRAPLIPMEHCTTRFFETCDLDNDKYIALEEWAGCFGIKEQDINKDLVI
ncbi:Osteonectin [Apodemus speciosus]|uniref:Osteonectin n=1 Tax=Apodemus speciosus TaxID=105296 RepID=A0ABQ0FA13_APOSI